MLVDQASYGGTMYIYLINHLVKQASQQLTTSSSTKTNNQTTNFTNIVQLKNNINEINGTTTAYKSFKLPQIVLYGCLLYESLNYKKCPNGYDIVAKTDINDDFTNIILNIPYPMIGKWYLALWRECYDRLTK